MLKKRFYQEKSDLYCETEKELDFLKRIRSVLCKAKKKKWFWFVKIRFALYKERKKKRLFEKWSTY